MKNDPKQRFLLMLALGLTMLLFMQYVFPPPVQQAPQATQHGDNLVNIPQTAPAAIASEVPEEARKFQPEGDYQVTVKVGPEGATEHGYQASFSTIGGGLSDYRLLGFFRQPQDDSPENRMILLNRFAANRDSLRVENVTYGTGRQDLRSTAMRTARYELLEVPAGAEIEPSDASVKRGENLVMRTVVGDWEVVRTYRFPKAGTGADFTIPFDLEWRNLADGNRLLNYNLVGPAGVVADDDSMQFGVINFLTARQPSSNDSGVEIERKPLQGVTKERNMSDRDNRAGLAFVGAKNRFFATIMSTEDKAIVDSNGATRLLFPADPSMIPNHKDVVDNLKKQPVVNTVAGEVPAIGETSLTVEPGMVAPGGTYKGVYRLYAGPAVDDWMEKADPRMSGVVSYTWRHFDFISRWLVRFLTFLDGILGNYGLAIIVMTIIVKMLLHPLNRKSFVSMNKMSKLAPKMKELQKKYAGDKVKLQQEMNRLYKDNGVSMAGGCLPVFLQLPIFFALYGAFSQGFSMRHAAFLPPWIKDLSKPDSVHDLGFTIPLLGSNHISLLPILYFVLQYIQMSLQPKPSDPQQAQQQKIMKFMPLMFVFLFYSMPAGLVLYFTVSALCGIVENYYMRKSVLPKLGLADAGGGEVVAAGAAAGAGAASTPSKKKKRR